MKDIRQDKIIIKNTQDKCLICGSTHISFNTKEGVLNCTYCKNEFKIPKPHELYDDINKLEGKIIGLGASDIKADASDIVTLKCSSCNAEIVVDTNHIYQAKCHWCRNTLSINEQIPNGSVPDLILPFKVAKKEAMEKIEIFVSTKKKYAVSKFIKTFNSDNVVGLYLPYMVVDINGKTKIKGIAEETINKYKLIINGKPQFLPIYDNDGNLNIEKDEACYYDAKSYEILREFDIVIDDLIIDINQNNDEEYKTLNIINSILPFDIENAVKWNANYLQGFISEKRKINIDDFQEIYYKQLNSAVTSTAKETIPQYDRGAIWEEPNISIKGEQWKVAYLPIWLYSYQQKKKSGNVLHYVAVNGRTKETMGSIPLNFNKLKINCFLLVAIILILSFLFSLGENSENLIFYLYPSLLTCTVFGYIKYLNLKKSYENIDVKHHYNTDVKYKIKNIKSDDNFVCVKEQLVGSKIAGFDYGDYNGIKNEVNLDINIKKILASVILFFVLLFLIVYLILIIVN